MEECPTVNCKFTKLTAGKQYLVTATATLTNSQTRPASNSLTITMPSPAAPVLVVAKALTSTRATATARPPATINYQTYIFSTTPLDGSGAKSFPVKTLVALFTQLKPATTVGVTSTAGRAPILAPAPCYP